MRLCVNCKHCYTPAPLSPPDVGPRFHQCAAPPTKTISMVTGRAVPVPGAARACEDQRAYGTNQNHYDRIPQCGPGGMWFEPIPGRDMPEAQKEAINQGQESLL